MAFLTFTGTPAMSNEKRKIEPSAIKKEKKEKRDSKGDTKKKAKKDKDLTSIDDKNENDELSVADLRKSCGLTVRGEDTEIYKPFMNFADCPFPAELIALTAKFAKPSPIQSQCWPIALKKRDLIGIAETGSGKTIGFAFPGISYLLSLNVKEFKAPKILVLSPTRELALQIEATFAEALKPFGYCCICVYGGVSKEDQKKVLKRGNPAVVIATPGRCLDLIDEGVLVLSDVTYLVLDEADRMLDLGFERDVKRIIGETSKKRQTLMFSATWPASVERLASEYLKTPIQIVVGSSELKACKNVTQHVMVLDPMEKDSNLLKLLKKHHESRKNRIIIFVLYKKEADRVEQFLRKSGYKAQCLHGDKPQSQRTEAIEKFKEGKEPLLIATDVAARGLDVPDVEYVINYTFPLTIEDYVHRIGRTGRGGKQGVSYTFFTLHDKLHSGELCNVLKEANQNVPEDLMKFGTTVKKKEHKDYGAFYKPIDPNIKASHVKFDSDDE